MCSYRVQNYPEVCCEDSEDDEECVEMCRKAPPYCVSRRGCFSTFGGVEFIVVIILAIIAFFGAIAFIAYYFVKYSSGFSWRKYGSVESESNSSSLNMHSLLETIGFITLTGLTIVVFRVSSCCDRAGLRIIHLILSIIAAVLISLGVFLAWEVKDHERKHHFLTAHSWIGMLAVALFAAEVVFGILKFIILLACGPISCCLRASCRPIHSAFGLGAYWAAIAAGISGIVRSILYKSEQGASYVSSGIFRRSNTTTLLYSSEGSKEIKKIHIANGYAISLLVSGILVTYAVISRAWYRG